MEDFHLSPILRFFSFWGTSLCWIDAGLYDIDWLKAYRDFHSILGFIMQFQTQCNILS